MSQYDDDIAKAIDTSEHMRHGGPNNVLWLILQSLKWVGGIALALNQKLDYLVKHSGGGVSKPCDLSVIEARLDAIEALLQHPPVSKAGARIVVRGPVENR